MELGRPPSGTKRPFPPYANPVLGLYPDQEQVDIQEQKVLLPVPGEVFYVGTAIVRLFDRRGTLPDFPLRIWHGT